MENNDDKYIDQLEAHLDEGGKVNAQNVRDVIDINRRRREVTARFENETSPDEERHRYVKARLDKIEARLDKVETLAEECAYRRAVNSPRLT